MTSSTIRRTLGAASVPLCLLAAGCIPAKGQAPSPTPPSITQTSETGQERQMRLDYKAAEKAYRAKSVEMDRLFKAGGATKATPELRRTATGEYLDTLVALLQTVKERGWIRTGDTKIVGVVQGGWQKNELTLLACEDVSRVQFYDGKKKVESNSQPFYVQKYTATRSKAGWKLADTETTQMKTLEGQPCAM